MAVISFVVQDPEVIKKAQRKVTKIMTMIVMNLVTAKAAAKDELLFNSAPERCCLVLHRDP
jgi:hypothetical protein